MACNQWLRRKEVVVFVGKDYDFCDDVIREKFLKYSRLLIEKVCYVCKKCHRSLKKQPTKPLESADNPETKKPCDTKYICTCCHQDKHSRKYVVMFQRKNYDFKNESVVFCLEDSMRSKCGLFEYICKTCHKSLKDRHPRVPIKSAARKLKKNLVVNSCGDTSNAYEDLMERIRWHNLARGMDKLRSFLSLEAYLKHAGVGKTIPQIRGSSELDYYPRDIEGEKLLPGDVPFERDDVILVKTASDGNCFFSALSRLVYGDESHTGEMRVRLVDEAVKNMHLYLDNDYLSRGYVQLDNDNSLPTKYATEFAPDVFLTDEEVKAKYKEEVLNMCKNGTYSGVWQFHQAANVLDRPLFGIFPEVCDEVSEVRHELHRKFLPHSGKDDGPLFIMWTRTNKESLSFSHFVPIVHKKVDARDVDVDADNITDSVDDEREEIGMFSHISSRNLPLNSVTGYRCTCCHKKKVRKNVQLFNLERYNFSNDIMLRALSPGARVKSDNGYEYICVACDYWLNRENPVMPKCASANYECCTKCHESHLKGKMKYFDEGMYKSENGVDLNAMFQFERRRNSKGEEFICQNCHVYTISACNVAEQCVIERRKLQIVELKKSDEQRCRNSERYITNIEQIELMFLEKLQKVRAKWVQAVGRLKQKIDEENEAKEVKFMNKLLQNRDKAITNFRKCLLEFPEYVCTCCHRLLFKKSVRKYDSNRYDFDCENVSETLSTVFRRVGEGQIEYICNTCDNNLRKGEMPCQAVANNLQLPSVPKELSVLTRLELRCIALRIPFMMIRAQRKGGQGRISGPCVNVPATMKPITAVLPRVPEDTQLILVKFKRMLVYRSNYLCDFIRPGAVMDALKYLMKNNPYYYNIEVDNAWLAKFENDALFEDICENGVERNESNVNNSEQDDVHIQNDIDENGENCEDEDGSSDVDDVNDALEDATLAEEQEEIDRRATVTVEPDSTCVELDDIEGISFNIAPGEDSIPKYILMDDDFEVLAFPNMFPNGTMGYYNERRPKKLDLRRYINQRLFNVDSRFCENNEYIFAFQYATELKQLRSEVRIAMKKMSRGNMAGPINAGNMRDSVFVGEMIRADAAYKFMNNVRGTPAYWQRQLYDTLAMLRKFGTPTWFLTLSPAEFMWPEMIQAIGRRYGLSFTEEDVMNMDWEEKAMYLRRNPVTTCSMFQHRLESFFSQFLCSDSVPIGEIAEYCIKIEFQARGSPHAHCLLWVRGAPKVLDDGSNDEEVCDFVDQYVDGCLPQEGVNEDVDSLRYLVDRLQTHRHSSYCRPHVNATCRFHFPRAPTTKTIVSRRACDEDKSKVQIEERTQILRLVNERMERDMTLTTREILELEGIEEEKYLECLKKSSHHGTSVILRRDPKDVNTNNYNSNITAVWRANTDIQLCGDAYACIMYILSYVMKAEKGMSNILKTAAKEFKDKGVEEQMKKVVSAFANKRELGIHEAIYRVTSQWLFKKTRLVIFVNNSPKDERARMPKPFDALQQMEDDDEDIFMTSLHDRYEARPDSLEALCLAEFATKYVTAYDGGRAVIQLKNGLGCIKKRTKDAVMRCHKFSTDDDNYYFSRLVLFLPYRTEDELLGEFDSYEQHYFEIKDAIDEKAGTFNMDEGHIEAAMEDFMKDPPQISDWLAAGVPENKEENEGFEECLDDGQDGKNPGDEAENDRRVSPLALQYKVEALKETVSNIEYREMMRQLNAEQMHIVMFNRKWAKESIVRIRKGLKVKGFNVFMSGSGGTGKSFVIKLIYRDTVRLFRKSNAFTRDINGSSSAEDVIALLTAYTGTAAFNINGCTLHSALQLYRSSISDEKKTTMITKLRSLKQITLDEVSMVGNVTANRTNNRCAMIKHTPADDRNFGEIAMFFVGDLFQLAPVMECPIFERPANAKSASDLAPPIWQRFQLHELTQVMRQRDQVFADILNEVRHGRPKKESFADVMLKKRELTLHPSHPDYPNSAIHVYKKNVEADIRNEAMLNNLPGELFIISAIDSTRAKEVCISKLELPETISQTGNLRGKLLLKIGARVLVTTNIDVADGITNGVFGTVQELITNTVRNKEGQQSEEVQCVLVKFDSERVGVAAKLKSPFRSNYPEAVPIKKKQVNFPFKGVNTVYVTRKNFPLSLAWAVTIHKVQGMTMDEIVVDMTPGKGRYDNGQAYVALSRVRTYENLHIINYDRNQIRASAKVHSEMKRLEKNRLEPLEPSKIRSIDSSQLKILHLNVQGLNIGQDGSKLLDFQGDDDVQLSDVLCITESHLNNANLVTSKDIWNGKRGHIYRNDRQTRQGGGVMIVVDEKFIQCEVRFPCNMEVLGVKVICEGTTMIIAVYIPPSTSKLSRIEGIKDVLRYADTYLCDRLVITGDFNEDLHKDESHPVHEMLLEKGFEQHLDSPTTDYGSLLDHIYTKDIQNVTVDVQDCYYSDHDKSFCFLP